MAAKVQNKSNTTNKLKEKSETILTGSIDFSAVGFVLVSELFLGDLKMFEFDGL